MQNTLVITKEELERLKSFEEKCAALEKENKVLSECVKKFNKIDETNRSSFQEMKDEITELKSKVKKSDGRIEQLKLELSAKEAFIDKLKEIILERKLMEASALEALYGQSSEKTKTLVEREILHSEKVHIPRPSKPTQKRGRKSGIQNFDDKGFETEKVVYETAPEKLICSDCGCSSFEQSGSTKILKISVKRSYIKREINILNYKCNNCGHVIMGENLEADCFGNMACTPELAGELVLCSAGLYLPYERISTFFSYADADLSKELISRYCAKTAELLTPVYDHLKYELNQEKIIHVDETTYDCLKSENKTNFIWVGSSSPRGNHKISYFVYSDSRAKDNVKKIIDDDYRGCVCSDGYSAYEDLQKHQLCWSHARRKIIEYLKSLHSVDKENKEKPQDYQQMEELEEIIENIFCIENEIATLSSKDRFKERQKRVKPLVEEYFTKAKQYYNPNKNDKKNQAIAYSLNSEECFKTFLTDGDIDITNNLAERTARKAVMKRVSSFFSVSKKGASTTCVLLSLVRTAVDNGLAPDRYITYLLKNQSKLKANLADYMPWSTKLPKDLRYSKAEKDKASSKIEEVVNEINSK